MQLSRSTAEIFVPDGLDPDMALARATHMGIGAHQDDLEIMAYDGILSCFQRQDRFFVGVVVTDGSGSPRDDLYRNMRDEDMRRVRRKEQRKAAVIGEYAAQVLLDHPSSSVKDPSAHTVVDDLTALFTEARPEIVYTHNLADKHDTHVAVALRLIAAIRALPEDRRPRRLYGCEVWRDLDWMSDAEKIVFDVSAHANLQAALLGVFDSQICGGKRYDLATIGRRRANATYASSHTKDDATAVTYAMDLTPLAMDATLDVATYVHDRIQIFMTDVNERLQRLE